jgi:hypothetical protein
LSQTPNAHDVESLVLCATNEGDMYPTWCAMARGGANTTDSEWAHKLRAYRTRLIREGRYDGSLSAETINTAAAQVRDYYLRHVAES